MNLSLEKIKHFQKYLKKYPTAQLLILLVTTGVLAGILLNIAFGIHWYNIQGILGAVIAISVVYFMS